VDLSRLNKAHWKSQAYNTTLSRRSGARNLRGACKADVLECAWDQVRQLISLNTDDPEMFYRRFECSMDAVAEKVTADSEYSYGQIQKLLSILIKYFFVYETLHPGGALFSMQAAAGSLPAPIDRNTVKLIARETEYAYGWDRARSRLVSWLELDKVQVLELQHVIRSIAEPTGCRSPLLWEMQHVKWDG
jgi:hypothetical protein